MLQHHVEIEDGERAVTYEVQVQGRSNHMRFSSYSKADAYRRVMLAAGKFARIL